MLLLYNARRKQPKKKVHQNIQLEVPICPKKWTYFIIDISTVVRSVAGRLVLVSTT